MPTTKAGRDLEVGDVLEVLGQKRRIVEIDKDREVPKPWRPWCDVVWSAHFADGMYITIFMDDRWEVF